MLGRLRHLRDGLRDIQTFSTWREYRAAARRRDDGETILTTRSGLRLAIRHNTWDAIIVREQFIDREYIRGVTLPARPVIVDVGAYIGDFALWCAHELGARVVAYEPTAENIAMLKANLALNPHIADRVTLVERGVAATTVVTAHVQVHGREIHASTEWYGDDPTAEHRPFLCDTLTEVLDRHGLERVDLLKVDCEGGEYSIFPATPPQTYARIASIVYEWHKTEGWEGKLAQVERVLRGAGYTVTRRGGLGYASRHG